MSRRQRVHELVLALLAGQGDVELLDADAGAGGDAGGWLERNRRVVQRYQALVRSAVTLDALIDQEVAGEPLVAGEPRAADRGADRPGPGEPGGT